MLEIDLRDKVVLVSGGSRGIGRATAVAFAKAGAKVSFGYKSNTEAANETLKLVTEAGGEAIATQIDIRTAEGCEALAAATTKAFGKVDVLVNNAGGQANDVFMLLKDEQFEQLYAEHVMSIVRMSRLCATGMLARRWGRIINFSSVAAQWPAVGQSNYAAVKGAVESLTVGMAVELCKRNVNVTCLNLGLIETDMARDVPDLQGYLNRSLIKRMGKTEEIAGWIVMLASKYGDYITGQVLHLDGGYRLI